MNENLNDQIKKMIEEEEATKRVASSIATLYNSLLACGLTSDIAVEFVKTILANSITKEQGWLSN